MTLYSLPFWTGPARYHRHRECPRLQRVLAERRGEAAIVTRHEVIDSYVERAIVPDARRCLDCWPAEQPAVLARAKGTP